jgi:hypothetical protein
MIHATSQRAHYYSHCVQYQTTDSLSANPAAQVLAETQIGLAKNPFRRQIGGLQKEV